MSKAKELRTHKAGIESARRPGVAVRPRVTTHPLREARRDAVRSRGESAAATPQEQLDRLDARLGAGRGARRERERLHRLIAGAA